MLFIVRLSLGEWKKRKQVTFNLTQTKTLIREDLVILKAEVWTGEPFLPWAHGLSTIEEDVC